MGRGYSANRSHSARPTNKQKRSRSSSTPLVRKGGALLPQSIKTSAFLPSSDVSNPSTSIGRDPRKLGGFSQSKRSHSNANRTSSRIASVERRKDQSGKGQLMSVSRGKQRKAPDQKNGGKTDPSEKDGAEEEEIESDDDDAPMENESETIRRTDVLTKYKEGGKVVDAVLSVVEAACVPGANTKDLCCIGDTEILERMKGLFKKNAPKQAISDDMDDDGKMRGSHSVGPHGHGTRSRSATGRPQDRANSTSSRATSKAAQRARSASVNPLAVWYQSGVPRGVSFPFTVCVNETLCHHTPFSSEDAVIINAGDVVKVHCGVHIDGYPVSAARTFVVKPLVESQEGAPVVVVPEEALNAIEAARMGVAGMARLMRPGADTDDVTDFLHKVGHHYEVEALEGVLSTRTKRWLMDSLQAILCRRVNKEEPVQEVLPSIVEPYQIWSLDVSYTDSPQYKLQIAGDKLNAVNIFRKNEIESDICHDLRSKCATELLHSEIKNKFHCFPWNPLHADEPLKARLGLSALKKGGQIDEFPEMHCKKITANQRAQGMWQPISARFSATIAITDKRIHFLCGEPNIASSITERYAPFIAPNAVIRNPSEDIVQVLCSPLTIIAPEDLQAPMKKARAEARMVALGVRSEGPTNNTDDDAADGAVATAVSTDTSDKLEKEMTPKNDAEEEEQPHPPSKPISKFLSMHPDNIKKTSKKK